MKIIDHYTCKHTGNHAEFILAIREFNATVRNGIKAKAMVDNDFIGALREQEKKLNRAAGF